MLLFHGEVPWGGGGFVSITLFFTLSGFLVTTLLLDEHDQHGGIAMSTFWARRARRLLPSALLTIAAVLALTPHLGDVVQRAEIRGDAIASTLYAANWRFLASGQGYDAQFGADSPLLHFWSLAIEEQFYLVWPCVVFAVLGQYRPRRNGRRNLAVVVALGIGASVVSSLLSSSFDRSYYGTDTRAAELMVGAALALLVADPRFGSAVRRLASFAPVALAAFCTLVVVARLDDEWIRRGGRLGIALISASIVASAWLGRSAIARLFATEPIGAIGRISYTWYLVHWPVFRFLDQSRSGLDGYALFALRIAVSLLIAAVIYHLFECPMRFRRWVRRPRFELAGAVVATVAILAFAWSTSVVAIPEVGDAKFAVDRPSETKPTALVLGDQHARERVESSKAFARVDHIELVDCPLAPADELRDVSGAIRPVGCRSAAEAWGFDDAPHADVVIVVLGAAEVDEVSIEGTWTSVDALDRLSEVRAALDRLIAESHAAGSVTVVVRPDDAGRGATLRDAVVGSTNDALGATVARSLDADDLRAAVAAARLENRPPWPTPLGSRTPDVLRVLVVGDSTSFWVAAGLEAVGKESGRVETAWLGAAGCPLVRADEFQSVFETVELAACPRFDEDWAVAAESFGPDIVLVVSSIIDAGEYRLEPGGEWVAFGDPTFDEYWRAEADAAIGELAAAGAVIVWADAPTVQLVEGDATARWNLRLARYNELVAALDADYSHVVTAPFSTPLGAPGTKVDRDQRPDGSHLAPAAAVEFARDWLLVELDRLWREAVTASISSGCMSGAGPRPTIDLAACVSGGSESR